MTPEITVFFDDRELERMLQGLVDRATGGLLTPLREELDRVASDAAAAWYTQVDRETGTTGQIRTEVTIAPDFAAVSVGSTRLERTEKGAEVARVVHRPGPTSTVREYRPVSEPLGPGERVTRRYGDKVVVAKPNPKRSDGKSVLVDLVERPARAALDRLIADGTIDRAIQRRIEEG